MATLIENANRVLAAQTSINAALNDLSITSQDAGLEAVTGRLTQIGAIKTGLRNVINSTGTDYVTDSTPFSEYPDKVQALADDQALGTNESLLVVTINPTGSHHFLPEGAELTALLTGAKIIVANHSTGTTTEQVITDLNNATYSIPLSNVGAQDTLHITLQLGNLTYRALGAVAKAKGGQATYTTLVTHPNADCVEVGRAQRLTDSFSFLVRRWRDEHTNEVHTAFGGFVNTESAANWNDQSGIKVTVTNRAAPTEEDPDPVATEVTLAGGTGSKNIVELLDCLKDMEEVTVDYLTDTPVTGNKFMRYKPVWVKTSIENLDIPIFGDDGTVLETVTRQCVIKWACNIQADSRYHLHPLFERYVRDPDTGSFTTEALPHGYIARYPIKFETVKYNGGSNFSVAASRPDGSKEVGAQRATFLSACRAINQVPVTITCGNETKTLAANADSRRWSMCAHGSDVGFLQWMAYLMYGPDVQNGGLRGICSTATTSSTNGVTDSLFNAGIMFGALGAGDTAHTVETNPIIFCGIEDALWSSTGWMTADLTFFNERAPNNEDGSAGATSPYLMYCRDRADYNPGSDGSGSSSVNSPLNGYVRLAFNTSGNDRIGYDPAVGARDLMVFAGGTETTWEANDEEEPSSTFHNIRIKQVDASWYGGAPAASVGGGRSAFVVALGGYRGYGASLGAFYLNAGRGLTYSYGDHWRARASLQLSATEALA